MKGKLFAAMVLQEWQSDFETTIRALRQHAKENGMTCRRFRREVRADGVSIPVVVFVLRHRID